MSALRRSAKVVSLIDETEAPLSALQLNDYPRRQRRDERLPWLVPQLKARPLRGSHAWLIPPASWTLNPRIRASLPIAAPPSRASCGLKLEPIKIDAGNAVAPLSSGRYPGFVTPMLASLLWIAGMPSRGTPGV